jgi:DNA-binding NarL/FixJ family response regulator
VSASVSRMPPALSPVADPDDALLSGTATGVVVVAVVTPDAYLVKRVAAALRRDGMAANVEVGGQSRLALDRLSQLPDVVVLAGDAVAAAGGEVRRIRMRLPGARIVLIVAEHARSEMRRLLDTGVDGIVRADAIPQTLALVVRSVCAGHICVPRDLRHSVEPPALSFRERQILALVVAGLTNDEIAGRLYLAETTVKGHLTSAFRRLGVRSRREAVALILGADESLRRSVLTARHDTDAPEGARWP